MDMAHALFDMELDDDFVDRMDETAKLINECKSNKQPSAESSNNNVPPSAAKRRRQTVHFGRTDDDSMDVEEIQKENNKDYVKSDAKDVEKVRGLLGKINTFSRTH